MTSDMTERHAMDKPRYSQARPLADLLRVTIKDAFARQGFAATELVTRWPSIVGPEIAAHSEPDKIQWPRPYDGEEPSPGTLVLRVEGPAAVEIQHLKRVILDRVNRFFGWQAVAELRLRQAPLTRREKPKRPVVDVEAAERIATSLTGIDDDRLRAALARLGAAIKQT
jgi:hypothetical protein